MNSELMRTTLKELLELKEYIESERLEIEDSIKFKDSLENMQHYLRVRSLDIRSLQNSLTELGLSSLGRSQAHMMDSIDKVIEILSNSLNEELKVSKSCLSCKDALTTLKSKTSIFGESEGDIFKTKIMITLPSEASRDKSLIEGFIESGADILRVNTAHDSPEDWKRMAKFIEEINQERGKNLKIYTDLAGPKIRTENIKKVKSQIKIGSKKEQFQDIHFVADGTSKNRELSEDGKVTPPTIVVVDEFLKFAKDADYIEITDIANRKRFLKIKSASRDLVIATLNKKSILDENSSIKLYLDKNSTYEANMLNIEELPEEIRVFIDDKVLISTKVEYGMSHYESESGEFYDAVVKFNNSDILSNISVDDRVFIDDGKIELIVVRKLDGEIECRVIQAKDKGAIIKEEKGINFPDSNLKLNAITNEDREALKHIVEFTDIFGISFAQTYEDVMDLKNELKKYGKENPAIVTKIETQLAVRNLPQILRALLTCERAGVMIARGDLAIEIGFERLAYIQEEILDLCSSAHIPVIYATQVLENKMKKNLPSRAEITDAAFGQRADCIMLNKGAFAKDTIKVLKSILRQMHTIFQKNRQLLNEFKEWSL